LIAPKGIEIKYNRELGYGDLTLLIAPKGIEIEHLVVLFGEISAFNRTKRN